MWVIQEQATRLYFRKMSDGMPYPIWTDTLNEAMMFDNLEDEETYRSLNLSTENAQPLSLP